MSGTPKISVIVPTRNRASFLPQLLELYRRQTWNNKELLILDDSEQEDTDFINLTNGQSDVHYWHHNARTSIGNKRNVLIEKSTGDIIAHFDDDDYYAPNYLSWMQFAMHQSQADIVKLAGWFALHERSDTLGFWDTTDFQSQHHVFCGTEDVRLKKEAFSENALRSFATGYGFSYFYKKSCWIESPFPDKDHGEDSIFFENLLSKRKKIQFLQDEEAICLHVIHKTNTSRCFPNYIIPKVIHKKLFPALHESKSKEQDLPTVTICTLTHNREEHIKRLQKCVESQDYPASKIEWLILDDSTEYNHNLLFRSTTGIKIKYQRVKEKLKLGKKRNLAHKLCSNEYIVYMDDDDFYHPQRVRHAIERLIKEGKEIAGSTSLLIYFLHDHSLWLSGPFGTNHATAGTFAMTRKFAQSHFYDNESSCNEEKAFLNNYTIPMAQLAPERTMICISHESNTFDKKKMRSQGETARMRKIDLPEAIRALHQFLT